MAWENGAVSRGTATLTAAVVVLLATTAPAQAAQRITATPQQVSRSAVQTVHGFGWPVIEFCSRTVRVSVRSPQNAAVIAQRRVRENGRFTFRWVPDNKNIGPGAWRLVARVRCESGKDGSAYFVRASRRITIL